MQQEKKSQQNSKFHLSPDLKCFGHQPPPKLNTTGTELHLGEQPLWNQDQGCSHSSDWGQHTRPWTALLITQSRHDPMEANSE